jgi:hypothetical protein
MREEEVRWSIGKPNQAGFSLGLRNRGNFIKLQQFSAN